MKNLLIKLLLFFKPRPKKGCPKKSCLVPQKFLIVSTTGLGDTLWATPSIRALRETYPHSDISVLTSELGEQVLKNNPHIDELLVIGNPLFFSLACFFFILKKKKFDAIFLFHSSQRLVFPLCALLGAPKIIGTLGLNKDLDCILTHPLENKPQHEIERRLEMVRQVNALSKGQNLEFFTTQEDEKKIERFLESHQIKPSTLLIGLHPGAQNLFKQWHPSRFIQLGLKLKEKWPCKIFVTGSREEAALVAEIASNIPEAIPVAGELSLAAFATLQKKMALFVTNDTGPMHMAFAMKTPTIALFGPTDHELCGPNKATAALTIQKKKTCMPCLRKKCEEPFCLLQIGVNEVYERACELLIT
ncbi:MAG TPA: glycosyltransferase family 9 protein [Rhabdochlamydiaceae bacterium]|nr:glycosyltransferase family 9 protein [Rhabdochlamydiaceae bacterium]